LIRTGFWRCLSIIRLTHSGTRRRGQHGLRLVGHRHDLLDVRREARVEHLVGLVEDQVLDPAQRHQALADHVEDAPGGPDDDVRVLFEVVGLGRVPDAAVEQRRAEPGLEALPDRVDLDRELAGRRHDEDPGALAGRGEQALGGGDQEGVGLARPGRGLDDDVVAVEEGWYRFGLDEDGRFDLGARKGVEDAGLKAQLGKASQRGVLLVPPLVLDLLPRRTQDSRCYDGVGRTPSGLDRTIPARGRFYSWLWLLTPVRKRS